MFTKLVLPGTRTHNLLFYYLIEDGRTLKHNLALEQRLVRVRPEDIYSKLPFKIVEVYVLGILRPIVLKDMKKSSYSTPKWNIIFFKERIA